MELAIALVALVVAIAKFVSVTLIIKLFWAANKADLLCKLLRYTCTDRIEDAAYKVKVVTALKRKHKSVEYRYCLTRNQILKTLKTLVTYNTYYWNGTPRLWSTISN